MLPRLVQCSRALALIPKSQSTLNKVSVQAVRNYAAHKSQVEIHKEALATTNDLSVPSGSWQEYYSKKNSRYNMQIVVNVVACIVTFVLMERIGIFSTLSHPNYKSVEVDWSKPLDLFEDEDEE